MSRREMMAFGVALALAGCRRGSPSADATETASAPEPMAASPCTSDSLRPATAAPAEGLWASEAPPGRTRVAAMIGPAQTEAGSPQITRHVETIELGAGADSIRYRVDAASLRLEVVPPLRERATPSDSAGRTGGVQPAAVYAVTPLVLLASYEPCAASPRTPRIRYLRRDAAGGVVTDVMLRRESAEADGVVR